MIYRHRARLALAIRQFAWGEYEFKLAKIDG